MPSSLHPILEEILKSLADVICLYAERKSYGLKHKDAVTYLDEQSDALWQWELTNISLLSPVLQRTILATRANLNSISAKSKALDKLIRLIEKAASVEQDLPRIVEEYEKYNKIVRKESAAAQANLQKELKEKDKDRL